MGFWDNLLQTPWKFFTPRVQYLGTVEDVLDQVLFPDGFSVAAMWKSQPHLRTVVTFLARNTAHVGLHSFQRIGDEDRKRDRVSPVAKLLQRPNPQMTMFELLFALEADKKLYDRAYWWIRRTPDGPKIYRVPPAWCVPKPKNLFEVDYYEVVNESNKIVEIPVEEMVDFSGYSPKELLVGSPTLLALKDILEEQVQAALYRKQVWKRGGRVSAVLERPIGAKWSEGARDAFREDWYAKWTGTGEKAGGTPILEDGMTLKRIDFSPEQNQFVEASRLAMATIASAFHVQPSMVGVMEGANFSVVKEFSRMLYTETLGPDFEDISQRLNGFLLPKLGVDASEFFLEFNIQKKLAGSFEEQASLLSTSVGAPWMSRNEARGRMNLARIEGGDDLVTPLNVLIGGQASPQSQSTGNQGSQQELQDATQDETQKGLPEGPQGTAERFEVYPSSETYLKGGEDLTGGHKAADLARPQYSGYEAKLAEILRGYFKRQRASVESKFKAGKDGWWDQERWDRELGHDLTAWNVLLAKEVAQATLKKHSIDEDIYDPAQAEKWLSTVGHGSAKNINAQTKKRLDEALAEDKPDPARLDGIFGEGRAGALAATAMTTILAFGTQEAGKQSNAQTKTWITGPNPRDSHKSMDGETVDLRETFSNGLQWPGDVSGGAEEVAGCNCELQVNWEN